MSHRVEPQDLAATAAPYGPTPFLVYAGADGSARINHVRASIEHGDVTTAVCVGFGRGVSRHLDEGGGPLSLLWPAVPGQEFSLIADGAGTITDDTLSIVISAAVLHRPAPEQGDAATC